MSGRLIAGIGIRPGTEAADILACLDEALAQARLAGSAVPRLATLASRASEVGMIAAAAARDAQLIAIPDEALKGFEASCATRSTRIASLYGVGSVAEAAALAAAGPGGTLVQPRIATARVTCALARAAS
ncbi:cobalamin biosynthesis protein [Bosea sp. (in: a-proteobacteria)]|uniref:cobalamin biosynthesis protein n=1 Tax=Bosea sp. (in: a-proteobacteria) TaxID=1871050 RepID=UPI0025BE423A|nr:cobalamin biosynthesis protein [Bosea sp. (in: a-proteobacteria)]